MAEDAAEQEGTEETMKTSEQWWQEIKNDAARFNEWLIKQHRGEASAASRLRGFSAAYARSANERTILETIAAQEEMHASWVKQLLDSRGIVSDVTDAEARYWRCMLTKVDSFENGCAVGAHAEAMRLERIKAIAADASAPSDVRETFARILNDELFHERALRKLAGEQAMTNVKPSAEHGRMLLGLEP